MGDLFRTEWNPDEQSAAQAQIHGVVQAVTAELGGTEDVAAIRDRIEEAIAAAGLPAQPHKWVGDTASEIASGRGVVVDRRTDQADEE